MDAPNAVWTTDFKGQFRLGILPDFISGSDAFMSARFKSKMRSVATTGDGTNHCYLCPETVLSPMSWTAHFQVQGRLKFSRVGLQMPSIKVSAAASKMQRELKLPAFIKPEERVTAEPRQW
jgi:hypothetical protein